MFNAGACQLGNETVLLVRVEDHRGHSHLSVARSADGVSNWRIDAQPSFAADPANHAEEEWGVEDARVTWVEERGEWVIAYTAYSSSGPLVSLAATKDFVTFSRLGPVMPPENKDAAVFPRRFGNRYAMLHRPVASGSFGANIWLSFSPDLTHWGEHQVLLHARRGAWWDSNKIGLGPPPLETPDGWLILYHGVRVTAGGCLYRLGLALLDLECPWRVLRRSDEWVFAPETSYERQGDVNGVVFPCGWILDQPSGLSKKGTGSEPSIDNNAKSSGREMPVPFVRQAVGSVIRLYYGGADTCLGLATARLDEVLGYLRTCPEPKT